MKIFADKLNFFSPCFMTQPSSYGVNVEPFAADFSSPRRRESLWTCRHERAWCEGWWRRWEGWWGWWRATARRTAALLSRGCPAKPPLSVLRGERNRKASGRACRVARKPQKCHVKKKEAPMFLRTRTVAQQQSDHSDFKSEISPLHLAKLQQEAFYSDPSLDILVHSITSQFPLQIRRQDIGVWEVTAPCCWK